MHSKKGEENPRGRGARIHRPGVREVSYWAIISAVVALVAFALVQ